MLVVPLQGQLRNQFHRFARVVVVLIVQGVVADHVQGRPGTFGQRMHRKDGDDRAQRLLVRISKRAELGALFVSVPDNEQIAARIGLRNLRQVDAQSKLPLTSALVGPFMVSNGQKVPVLEQIRGVNGHDRLNHGQGRRLLGGDCLVGRWTRGLTTDRRTTGRASRRRSRFAHASSALGRRFALASRALGRALALELARGTLGGRPGHGQSGLDVST